MPPALTAQALLGIELPIRWEEQRQVLGFG
jgi:hypothetical protein